MKTGVVTRVVLSDKKDKNNNPYWRVTVMEDGGSKRKSNSFDEGEFKVDDIVTIMPNGSYFEFTNINSFTPELVAKIKSARKLLEEMWS